MVNLITTVKLTLDKGKQRFFTFPVFTNCSVENTNFPLSVILALSLVLADQ